MSASERMTRPLPVRHPGGSVSCAKHKAGISSLLACGVALRGPGVRRGAAVRHKSTPLAMASSLRMRSLRSAISIRAAPSRAPPSISRGGRPVSSSRDLSASQSCQPLSKAPATTSNPTRTLAAISESWLIVRYLPWPARLLLAQAFDFSRKKLGFAVLGGDPLEHLDALAQLLDLAPDL